MSKFYLADGNSADVKIKYFLSKFADKVKIYPPGRDPRVIWLAAEGKDARSLAIRMRDAIVERFGNDALPMR